MSRDIRSFFTVISKKSAADSKATQSVSRLNSKQKRVIADSDEDDVVAATPEKPARTTKKKPKIVVSSDSEDEQPKAKPKSAKIVKDKLTEPPKLKPVNVGDIFSSAPIKQSKVEPKPESKTPKKEESTPAKKSKSKKSKSKKGTSTELGIHSDEAFEKTLLQLDDLNDDLFVDNADVLEKTIEEASKEGNSQHSNAENVSPKYVPTPTEKKRSRKTSSSDGSTPSKRQKLEHTDSGVDPGQEAYEKKRYSAMLYQKYLNRGGPKHHGQKELPKGKDNCLNNLCFLRTGVLDSLESEEFEDIIKCHGGRIVHQVSKKVNYVVVGDDPGPSKLAKARDLGIPTISEDNLLDMILEKSGMAPKYSKQFDSPVSEDLGIGSENVTPQQSPSRKDVKSKPDKKRDSSVNLKEQVKKPVKNHLEAKTINTEKQPAKTEDTKGLKSDAPVKSKEQVTKLVKNNSEAKTINMEKQPAKTEDTKVLDENLSLTDKYKPKDLKSIIGQQGDNSNMNKLKRWLQNWHKNQNPEHRKKLIRPNPFAQNDDGSYFKCALLSGSPGVGKTTTATLVAKELGLDIVEFNASDTRSKRLLKEQVSQLLSTNTIAGFAAGQSQTNKNRVLLMDEVDGMAGNEDRGGIQELIQLIKTTSIPIICMCNDRNHQKMRSLVNYCFDLKFSKPKLEQVRGAMMSICFKEGLKIAPNALSEIIAGTGCDIRQTLNHLAIWAATGKSVTLEEAEKEAKIAKKDTVMGLWEVCRAVFTDTIRKEMNLGERSRLFFYDYSLGPLFVQENYLRVQPSECNPKESLLRAAKTADSISMGDIIDSKIRRSNNWSLLESEAMFSSVFPGHYMSGHFVRQINFPSWLGKNSSRNKFSRLLNEVHSHTRASTTASKSAMNLDYLENLRNAILIPLKKEGTAGVQKAIDVMKTYSLLRTDLDALVELTHWPGKKNLMADIQAQVKSSFTRTYNKEIPLLPFAAGSATAKKRTAAVDENLELDEDQVINDEEEDDSIENDASIKVKGKAGAAGKGKKAPSGASTSKKGDATKKSRAKKTK